MKAKKVSDVYPLATVDYYINGNAAFTVGPNQDGVLHSVHYANGKWTCDALCKNYLYRGTVCAHVKACRVKLNELLKGETRA